MITNMWEKSLYTKNVSWILHEMFEYDIEKANISILLQNNVISQRDYDMLCQMSKFSRQVTIGRMQKDYRISKIVNNGFMEARKALIQTNNIDDEEIVSIRKDALCLIRKPVITDFGHVRFTLRNVYSMMMRCMGLELYFGYDERDNSYNIDVKGISDEKLPYHQTFLEYLCNWLKSIQDGRIDSAIIDIMNYMRAYEERNLPIECYREFNSMSMLRIGAGTYGVFDITNDIDISIVNINFNREVLRELFRIFSEIQYQSTGTR